MDVPYMDQVRGQTVWMFHLKTNNLRSSQVKSTPITIAFSVSIISMHFVFPFCPIEHGFIVIPISKKSWETEANLLSDFSPFLPLRVRNPTLQEEKLRDFFKIKFTLGNLISTAKSSLLDRGMAEFIFPNATFLFYDDPTCFCCKLNLPHNATVGNIERFERYDPYGGSQVNTELPRLHMEEYNSETLIHTYEDQYTFLSCGDPNNEPPDFSALFMPYSKTTWALILLTIVGWPAVLSLIENDFNLKNVLKDFDALFIGWAMVLEQSHLRATNYKGRSPLYCYCGCVLLAIFILSNAYKGDNIQKLTKSFELVPFTHMAQLLKAGYKTYSTKSCMGSYLSGLFDGMLGNDGCWIQFDIDANASRNQYSDEQFKLWKPMGFKLTHGIDMRVDVYIFGKCQKMALIGWRSDLEPLEKQLKERHVKSNVYTGQEILFSRRQGWELKRYGSIKVLKRMWTIVESGIHSKMLNISWKPSAETVFEPRKFKIDGNIFVQFAFHASGLLLALLVFIAELHKRILLCFNLVCLRFNFLIRNFLKQTQQAFLFGYKFLVGKKKRYFCIKCRY